LRILYLTDNTSVHNRRFLEKLNLAGHEVLYWNISSDRAPDGGLPDSIESIASQNFVDQNGQPSQYRSFLPHFQRRLKEVQPDLVHAGPIQSCGYLAALAGCHPLLLMSWGSDLLVDADRNVEWKQATEFALQNADALFCDCDTVRKRANSFRVFLDSQIVQFPWGVKSGVFSSTGPLPPESSFTRKKATTTFIYTRSWSPLYGTDVLLDAFVRARSANPSLRLLLVGNGSQDESIRGFLQAHNLNDSIFLVGPQPAEMLPKWFRAADAYISCAKADGTSISLLEAMASGLPVVVTDIPSNREWVVEPDNGFLAPVGSPEGVAEKILQVAALSSHERKAISERNQRIVKERADWDKNFPRLLAMYERLACLAGNRSNP
jgi:glycosyltransferase involved in cell wall biosynthesis